MTMSMSTYPPSYRERFQHFRNVEDAKNMFIEELIKRVDDLTAEYEQERLDLKRETQWNRAGQLREEKLQEELRLMRASIDRNAFILVLIDGDGMIFEDHYLKQGAQGGKDAAAHLHSVVREYLRQELPELSPDCRIVARMYANLKGLAEACYKSGAVENPNLIVDFVRGFTHCKHLFDFVDVGPGQDRTDDKLIEVFKLHLFDCHCKQIISGCSYDNGYARILGEYASDASIVDRIALLEGVPFENELVHLKENIKTAQFHGLFRTTKLVPLQQQVPQPQSVQPLPSLQPLPTLQPLPSTPAISRTVSATTNGSGAWAAAAALPPSVATPSPTPKPAAVSPPTVPRNRYGQRVDPELKYDRNMVKQVKTLKLCNVHYLRGDCPYEDCSHDHFYKPSKAELNTLRYIARMAPCRFGSECEDVKCMYGHRCPAGNPCAFGDSCRFPDEMHDMDTNVVKAIKV